jgi:L-asparaginase
VPWQLCAPAYQTSADMTEPGPRRVTVFGLGGTIAMASKDNGAATPALSVDDLVSTVPGLAASGAVLDVVNFRTLPSPSLTFFDLAELIVAIDYAFADGATGVVVTQGTDTIEEVAYLLDLQYRGQQPVVVTGAMRASTTAGADGPANLLAAVITAAEANLCQLGVIVVFNDEIHAARRVRKTHTTRTASFQSPNGGPLGHIVEGTVRLLNVPGPRLVAPPPLPGRDPRVAVYTVVLGDDAKLLEMVAGSVDGLIVAAMGAGHVPESLVGSLTEAALRIPVVLASRTGSGSVLTNTYGYAGSERDLASRGLIPAGFLDPLKARLLLRCLLAAEVPPAEVRRAFAVAGGYLDAAY